MTWAGGCLETVELLNMAFQAPLIFNDGHEILSRIQAGDDLVEIVDDLNLKFGDPENGDLVRSVAGAWPALHRQAVSEMVGWALGKLDTDERIMIKWSGDAESPKTSTKFELTGNVLTIEFAHPPGRLVA